MFTKKMLTVFSWEFIQKIKSKGFIFSMIFMPIVIIGFTLIPTYLADRGVERVLTVAVADHGFAAQAIEAKLASTFADSEKNQIHIVPINLSNYDSLLLAGTQLVQEGVVDGFLLLDSIALNSNNIPYYIKGTGNLASYRALENIVNTVIMEHHAKKMNLSNDQIQRLSQTTRIKMIQVGSQEETEIIQKYLAGIILVMMLFFAIFNSGGSFMRGITEEKNNRVIEILISSVSPGELMTGKILGLGCVGLTQIFTWGLLGALFGGSALNFLSPFFLACFILYFIMGFLMYAGLFSVVGSVLPSEHDIQPVQAVLSLIGILPVALAVLVLQDPDSWLVTLFSYVPLLTPTLMILRMVISQPPFIQIVSTMIVLFFSLIATLHFARKVFHIALLMRGKKPSYREIMKWVRI